jgi:hypothetical protein
LRRQQVSSPQLLLLFDDPQFCHYPVKPRLKNGILPVFRGNTLD